MYIGTRLVDDLVVLNLRTGLKRRGRFHKGAEERVRLVGAALELRVKLAADHERMVAEFGRSPPADRRATDR